METIKVFLTKANKMSNQSFSQNLLQSKNNKINQLNQLPVKILTKILKKMIKKTKSLKPRQSNVKHTINKNKCLKSPVYNKVSRNWRN